MLGEKLLHWMHEDEHTVGYVSRRTGIDAGRLIDLIVGAVPTDDEVCALAGWLTGMPVDQLGSEGVAADASSDDPLRCYTVADVARILQVSQDTVRKEIKAGLISHVMLGERALRIPRAALEQRLSMTRRIETTASDHRARAATGHGDRPEIDHPRQGGLL